VILAVAMNAVSLYYYLIVLKHAFVFPAPEGIRPANAPASGFLVAALALAVLALGLAPDILLTPLANTIASPARPGATVSTGVPPVNGARHFLCGRQPPNGGDARSPLAAPRHPNDFDAFACRKPAAETP
jgi:hypothetical protein